ncbi:hypothetical protein FVE85_8359 [Porphyridium purpureum]|uniref:Uncharacterized protein n=1 Tax=Porphyridium purpureum TaxID=35688 RepID=A0A5J4YN73_PORPP|nr:hypothetical protein FVE85_8359 [Porphyridium purpureum]8JNN_A Chain A, LPP1 [Porphyridium purpureum]|eukprot:POR3743..scf244_11
MEAFVPGVGPLLGAPAAPLAAVDVRCRHASVARRARVAVRMADDGFADLQPGDPGYKPKAKEMVKVSELGVSPFSDDANSVTRLGEGRLDEIAKDIMEGKKTGAEIKADLKKQAPAKPAAPAKKPEKKSGLASAKDAAGSAMGAVQRAVGSGKRGLDLLREDFLQTGPERAGVGRQDKTVDAPPQFGEPGYVTPAYQRVKVSSLGISVFEDDANAVTKVGGIKAVMEVAEKVASGELKTEEFEEGLKAGLSLDLALEKMEEEAAAGDLLPDYLKPLPEDTPRKGMTWKNYVGR